MHAMVDDALLHSVNWIKEIDFVTRSETRVDCEDLEAKLQIVRSAWKTWMTKLDRDFKSYTANCEGVADPNELKQEMERINSEIESFKSFYQGLQGLHAVLTQGLSSLLQRYEDVRNYETYISSTQV